jgi:hypothetical protein
MGQTVAGAYPGIVKVSALVPVPVPVPVPPPVTTELLPAVVVVPVVVVGVVSLAGVDATPKFLSAPQLK